MNGQARRAARPTLAAALITTALCLVMAAPAAAAPTPDPTPTGTATVSPGAAVPDAGSAPVTTDVGGAGAIAAPVEAGPLAAQITTERYAIDLLNEQVTALDDDVALAQRVTGEAYQAWSAAHEALTAAQEDARDAAARAYQDADNLGPLDPL